MNAPLSPLSLPSLSFFIQPVVAAYESSKGLGELAILAGVIAGVVVVLAPAFAADGCFGQSCGGNGAGAAGSGSGSGGVLAALVAGKAAGILTPCVSSPQRVGFLV